MVDKARNHHPRCRFVLIEGAPCDCGATEVTVHQCKLDKSDCKHEFTEIGDPNQDYCTKCGQSVWAWAFMEMP